MYDRIKIKCPFCGAVISVNNFPGLESKAVICPICKKQESFVKYKRVTPIVQSEDSDTEYPTGNERTKYYSNNSDTEKTHFEQESLSLGKISRIGTGESFWLKPGRNVIGRKCASSKADIQINTAENKSMSREHIVIEVKKVPSKGYVHIISLFKEKVNKTFVGNDMLLYGDSVALNVGDIIRLPDADLKFQIVDSEETEF